MVFPVVGGTQDTAYDIDNGLKFNGANQSMSIAQDAGSGSNTTGTLSFWVKRSKISTEYIAYARSDNSNVFNVYFSATATSRLEIRSTQGGSAEMSYKTNMKFRDVSAWYHIVIAIDTTDGTAADRCKLFVNGSRITSFQTQTNFDQNDTIEWFQSDATFYYGGEFEDGSQGNAYAGYLAEAYLIDGQQLDASNFGEYNDNGVWIPKKYLGTFGNNGHKLEFQQSGTSANSSGIGADTSGNDNHFSVSNHGSNSNTLDTPTNNFCTLNSLIGNAVYTAPSYGAGGLTWTSTSNGSFGSSGIATIAPNSGKWYWEARINSSISNGVGLGARVMEGYFPEFNNDSFFAGSTADSGGIGYSVNFNNGHPQTNSAEYNTGNEINGGSALSANDILGIAMDLDNGAIYYAINGTWQASSDPESGASKTNAQHTFTVDGSYAPAVYGYSSTEFDMNFGGAVSFNVSSATSDTAGYGKFEYSVPDGYYALNTKNLGKYG